MTNSYRCLPIFCILSMFHSQDAASILFSRKLHSPPTHLNFLVLRGGTFAEHDCYDLRYSNSFANITKIMFATDLDDTLVGDRKQLAAFNRLWKEKLEPRECKLVYNSGRSLADYLALRKDWTLLTPDVYIGGCGTQIYRFFDNKDPMIDENWIKGLKRHWDKDTIMSIVFHDKYLNEKYGKLQEKRESQSNPYMFSLCIPDHGFNISETKSDFEALFANRRTSDGSEELKVQICAASVAYTAESTVTRSSSNSTSLRNIFIDVLPHAAGKGAAQAYIARQLGIAPAHTIVAGDSGNDIPMFAAAAAAAAGIVVGNARAELRAAARPDRHYFARRAHAGGILEGFAHMGVCSPAAAAAALCQEGKRERLRQVDEALIRLGYRISEPSPGDAAAGPLTPLEDDFVHPTAGEAPHGVLSPAGLPAGLMPPARYRAELDARLRRLESARGLVKRCVDHYTTQGLRPEEIPAQRWREWPPPAAQAGGHDSDSSTSSDDDDLNDEEGEGGIEPGTFFADGKLGGFPAAMRSGAAAGWSRAGGPGTEAATAEVVKNEGGKVGRDGGKRGPRTGLRDLARWAVGAQEELLRFLLRARPGDVDAVAARRDALVEEKLALLLAYRRAELEEVEAWQKQV